MIRLSSEVMWAYKIALPLGLIIIFLLIYKSSNDPAIKFIFFWIVILFTWGFAIRTKSDVYDMGNGLMVIHKNQEIDIPDSNIAKIRLSTINGTAFVTVYLVTPIQFGKKFVFLSKRLTGLTGEPDPNLIHVMERI